jgi:hypothetical protein
MKNTNVLIILQYNVRNERVRTMISLLADKNIQDYDVIAIQKFWRNFFAKSHWAAVKMIFIYYTNRKMTSESAFTSTIK